MKYDDLLIYAGAADGIPDRRSKQLFFKQIRTFIAFSQNNGLMRRVLLKDDQNVTASTIVMRSDLTDQGHRFFKAAYSKWSKAVEKGMVEPENTSFLAEILARIHKVKSPTNLLPKSYDKNLSKRGTAPKNRTSNKSNQQSNVHTISPDLELTEDDAAEYEAAGPYVYDKADWHLEGEFPDKLSAYQANVHTGMFVAWLCDHDMITAEFRSQAGRVKRRKITGAQAYEIWGGALTSDMLSEEGNRFARQYYEGKFGDDFWKLLVGDLPSFYHVEDTWESYEIMKKRIEERFLTWKKQNSARKT